MYTRCPKCLTCFRVTDRHLAIANGKVRCGQCQHVFNAPQHAVDDIPLNQTPGKTTSEAIKSATTNVKPTITPVVKPAEKKTAVTERSREEKIHPANKSTTLIEADEKPVQIQKAVKPQEIKAEKPEIKKTAPVTPVFDADATMIADISSLKKDDVIEIDLDAPAATKNNRIKSTEEKPVTDFTDSGELNAAIEALTQENNKAGKPETSNPVSAAKSSRPETNTENIFSTDAYDATSATSVADVFNEIGQLSLDISAPQTATNHITDDEFEFFSLNAETSTEHDVTRPKNKNEPGQDSEKSVEEQFLDEFDLLDETTSNKNIDPDELFDQVDISDFDDDETNQTIKTESNDHAPQSKTDEIPFQLRHDIERLQAPQRRRWHPLFSVLFILILLAVSLAQLAYFRAHEVVKILPAAQPWLEVFCTKAHCLYSGPRDIRQIQLLSRDVRQHPKEKNALLISASMVNQAEFAQPYPDIHIRLSDISGNVVAERIFNAKTYMGKLSSPFLLMKSKTPVHITFEVIDPGKDAVNFEFTFQ